MTEAALPNIDDWHDFPARAAHDAHHQWDRAAVRPFNRDACLDRARAARMRPDGKPRKYGKLDMAWADFTGTLGVISEREARFWLGLCLDTPFYVDTRRIPTYAYFDESFDLTGTPDVAEIVSSCAGGRRQHMTVVARLLREIADYDEVLAAIFDTFSGRRLADWVEALGPPPQAARSRALKRAEEHFAAVTDQRWRSVLEDDVRLLNALPAQPPTIALVRGMAASMADFANLPRKLAVRLDPSKPLADNRAWLVHAIEDDDAYLDALDALRSARVATNPAEVAWFLLRRGARFQELMRLVVRRVPTTEDPDVWAELLRVRAAGFVEALYPVSDSATFESGVAAWMHHNADAARSGLRPLLSDRGKRRAFAIEWLAELDGEALEPVAVEDDASTKWREWADQHETSDEQDDDLEVPTLGLDALGRRVFDFGPRRIAVEVVGHDDARWTDLSTGRVTRRIPTVRKADDARKVAAAKDAWAEIRPHLRSVFAEQSDRLELAMLRGRRWPIDFWMSVWLEHPVLAHIARRTVWLANTEERTVAVLPSVENDFHDARYEDVRLPTPTTLTVAHPVDLDVPAWAKTFAELEIVQPFPQLERLSRPFDVGAIMGRTLDPDALLDCLQHGWQARTTGTQMNRRDELVHAFGGVDVVLGIEPGLRGSADRRSLAPAQDEQLVTEVWMRPTGTTRKLPEADWPARHRFELGRLLWAIRVDT